MILLGKLDALPPFMYRVLARHANGVSMTGPEIAALAGLDVDTVRRLSRAVSWSGIPIGTASKFMHGCRVNPFKLKYHLRYIRRMKKVKTPRVFRPSTNAYYARLIKRAEAARA
jgi:hypothetical protein